MRAHGENARPPNAPHLEHHVALLSARVALRRRGGADSILLGFVIREYLARAGLVTSRQEGRFVIYAADFQNMNALVGYL